MNLVVQCNCDYIYIGQKLSTGVAICSLLLVLHYKKCNVFDLCTLASVDNNYM